MKEQEEKQLFMDLEQSYIEQLESKICTLTESIAKALHQIHKGKTGHAIQILNHLLDDFTETTSKRTNHKGQ